MHARRQRVKMSCRRKKDRGGPRRRSLGLKGKPVGFRHGRATVTGERSRTWPLGLRPGKARESVDPEVRRPASGQEMSSLASGRKYGSAVLGLPARSHQVPWREPTDRPRVRPEGVGHVPRQHVPSIHALTWRSQAIRHSIASHLCADAARRRHLALDDFDRLGGAYARFLSVADHFALTDRDRDAVRDRRRPPSSRRRRRL